MIASAWKARWRILPRGCRHKGYNGFQRVLATFQLGTHRVLAVDNYFLLEACSLFLREIVVDSTKDARGSQEQSEHWMGLQHVEVGLINFMIKKAIKYEPLVIGMETHSLLYLHSKHRYLHTSILWKRKKKWQHSSRARCSFATLITWSTIWQSLDRGLARAITVRFPGTLRATYAIAYKRFFRQINKSRILHVVKKDEHMMRHMAPQIYIQ